jgi:two-component system chemotaxis response regulator CheY
VPTIKTVIVADDTAFVRDRFSQALASAGHSPVAVDSAADLLSRIRDDVASIDLIVLDLRLPNSGGVELVRAIRRIDSARRVPVLVFSGTIASADEVRDLAALGVSGYVNEYSAPTHILPALAPHLFPDSFNRRSSPRVVLGIPVSYRFDNTIAAALTLNISKGGVAIRTMNPLQADSRIRTRFRLPGRKEEIEADARVAWSDRRLGMGLQFVKVEPAAQKAIDDFVDQHFFSNRKA